MADPVARPRSRLPGVAWTWLLAVALLLLALPAGRAEAAPADSQDEPMQFAVVRDATPGCEPNCAEWIAAEGRIYGDTAARFRKFLKKLGKRRLPVLLQSAGGDVDSAMAIGRLLRQMKTDVVVGQTSYLSCHPRRKGCKPSAAGVYLGVIEPSTAFCASACPLILASGIRRVVPEEALVGVHQLTATYTKVRVTYRVTYQLVGNRKRIVSKKVVGRKAVGSYSKVDPKDATDKVLSYLKQMGIGREIADYIDSSPPSSLHVLTADELSLVALATDRMPAAAFVTGGPSGGKAAGTTVAN